MKFIFLVLVCNTFLVSCSSQSIIMIEAVPNGLYELPKTLRDKQFVISGSGSKEQPFIFKGASGNTKLYGNSAIKVLGSHIAIENLEFIDNEIKFSKNKALIDIDKSIAKVSDIVVSNCNFSQQSFMVDNDVANQFYWIYVNADSVRIFQNSFQGKQNRLPIIHVEARNSKTFINNNYFANVTPRKGEALEAIRVGLGNGSADCTIASNLFSKYHGDSETVSIKANNVRLFNNTFFYCRSGISLRAAENSIIEENIFTFTNLPLRLSGTGHKINGNIFKGAKDADIVFMVGGKDYNPVSSVAISNNVFHDDFTIGVLRFKEYSILPESISLNDNQIINKNEVVKLQDLVLQPMFFQSALLNKTSFLNEFNLETIILK